MNTALATAPELVSARDGVIQVTDMKIGVWEEHVEEAGIRRVYKSILAHFRGRGFDVKRDPGTAKHYPTLSPWHHAGEKRRLEFSCRVSGRYIEIDFFQSVNLGPSPNPNGPRYDSQRFARLPRHMRLHAVAEMVALIEKLHLNYSYRLDKDLGAAPLGSGVLRIQEHRVDLESDALTVFNRSWSPERFKRGPDGWPAKSEYQYSGWGYHDRDGVEVQSGDVRYARVNGRLVRGRVHPGVNGWWDLVSNGSGRYGMPYYQLTAKELFRCDRPDLEPRRLVEGQIDRLHKEIEKHLKEKNYQRVAAISAALNRLIEKQGAP